MKPTATLPLPWHDEAELLGVRVRVYFFDPAEVDARSDFVGRQLPILQGTRPQLLAPEGQRETYRVGALQAQPDAVLTHGNGLLCLSYKGGDGRPLEPGRWRQHWRVDTMLQGIASAMAVAGQSQRPTAALWRGSNVLCQFDPGSPVLECLATHIGAARHYWREPAVVSPAQLASFCEPRLRVLPGLASAEPAPA
jgi:hypothetical protein